MYASSGKNRVLEASTLLYLMAFSISTFQLLYFPRYQGVPNLHQGALCPLDAPQLRNFCTHSDYFTISNCVFNSNYLALVLSEILGGGQIYIRGPCAPRRPLSEKILTCAQALAYIYIIVNFQLCSSINAGLTERSLYNRFCIERSPKMFWGDFGSRG